MAHYRIRVELTYSKVADANAARSALSTTLANYPTVTGTVSGTGTDAILEAEAPDQATAEAFHDSILPDWNRGTRNAGKVSVVVLSDLA